MSESEFVYRNKDEILPMIEQIVSIEEDPALVNHISYIRLAYDKHPEQNRVFYCLVTIPEVIRKLKLTQDTVNQILQHPNWTGTCTIPFVDFEAIERENQRKQEEFNKMFNAQKLTPWY